MTSDHTSQPASGGEQRLFSQPSFPELYEQALVAPLFAPWVEPLLSYVDLGPGDRVLDLACGTGIVARVVKERLGPSGQVVGVDQNAQMLAVARRITPSIDWREGDAGALPLRDAERFDVVLCQQGFQFFPDPAAAALQVHRALVAGGRLGLSAWRPDEESPVLHELRRIAERHLGPVNDRRHALGEVGPFEDLLRQIGFREVRSTRLSRTIRFDDGAVFVRLNAMALVSMSAGSSTFADAERERVLAAIARDSAELVRRHTDRTGFSYELATNLVRATV